MKLLAPTPGWTATADVIVVGSGIAGLTTALQCRTYGLSVLLVTKARVDEGSTKWAQGGIAPKTPKPQDTARLIWNNKNVSKQLREGKEQREGSGLTFIYWNRTKAISKCSIHTSKLGEAGITRTPSSSH